MSYSPTLGRWIQTDPKGYVDGLSLYEYVRSNPLKFVDPLGTASFVFDGQTLKEVGSNGEVINSWPAVSGRPTKGIGEVGGTCPNPDDPANRDALIRAMDQFLNDYAKAYEQWLKTAFDYSTNRQKIADTGPTPEGTYTFNSGNVIDFTQMNYFRRLLKYHWDAWGDFAIPLTPNAGTDTYGRGGMYIHGGANAGSAGCVDLTDKINDFIKRLKELQDQQHTLSVDYPQTPATGPATRPTTRP